MRCKACHALLVGVLSVALAGAAQAGTPRVTITPSRGDGTTRFVLQFAVPGGSGISGSMRNDYLIRASTPTQARGCVRRGVWGVPPAKPHARVRVTLNPAKLGGHWCVGTFHGTVEDIMTPVCQPGRECPMFLALLHVRRFSFQVGRRRP